MLRKYIFRSALAALSARAVLAQSTTTSNPLNNWIGGANSAVNIIQSASASAASATKSSSTSASLTSASSTSPSPTHVAATSPAASLPSHGSSNHKTVIIAVVCAVVGAVLLALLLGLLCWCLLRRRRKNRKERIATPVTDDEVKGWKGDHTKHHDHTYIPPQYGRIPEMEEQPMIAPAAVAGGNTPNNNSHPAYRHENPFVPVPPSPRRTAPNSRSGLTDGTVPGDKPYVEAAGDPERKRLRSRSRSHSRPRANTGDGLPTTTNADRPPTPFGLSGIGQPYEDMHVHVLQHDAPSKELQQSLNNRDPLASAQRGSMPGYSTPPEVPNRSPRRSGQSTDSPYTTETGSYTGSGSDEYYPSYSPATTLPQDQQNAKHRHTNSQTPLMSQPQYLPDVPSNRFNNSPTTMQAPPVPWAEGSPGQRRHSPVRSSGEWAESGRRASRSPATSINGQPRRLRFSDLQASPTGYGGWDERYGHGHGGVGEAL